MPQKLSTIISPEGSLEVLSQQEVNRLRDTSANGLHDLLRRCSLAVLNCGNPTDDSRALMQAHHDFEIEVLQQDRGIRLKLDNAPHSAFVDGQMIRGIREHLSAVLRDIVYVHNEIQHTPKFDLQRGDGITNAVFHILRNAGTLKSAREPSLVVCWGGHSITREEYDYSKDVGYHLGLRDLDICTGCGPGAMKGPMKGANVAHAKQRRHNGRYLGISEPGIIAAESPNPIVNELVIMPDIEKRLEAFVRAGHGIVIFPGGVGTAEEILYLLGILLHPDNADVPFPVIFTGPRDSADYFKRIDEFLAFTLGEKARERYQIIIDDPTEVGRAMRRGVDDVGAFRRSQNDAFYFNWRLNVDAGFQLPFEPTHESMVELALHREQPVHELAANLRRAFSGIVAGNVKEEGIRAIEERGPFHLHAEPELMAHLDALLTSFVAQERMKLPGSEYVPCYTLG
ncbi:LOG family protein [Chromohalobacter salexigens]|uniref:AMP nucleosidase n=2 Tax=Chromohalobacter TaxID=42054 RepID=A0A9X2X4S8_9GAMM|nr:MULTISPECIES: nucleotide 5'-monophosphate nucleosidase PpnN [Chromohalobacter]NWO11853.1 LOG family protein [Chromohalobacter salexigens]CDQ32738.1 LOG family protein YgdH [Virgibacillus halodenitrificans]MCK0769497.1 nucleotide 5'-monophosphate nucleosidase PpnN [Chromohalobacter canadensis]MCK2042291.1 nucleotide 5'-monophosphate nucleosidase PpnN [Chromohalobacter moromii]MCK2047233.1 nucleotide 5'-monophosphate nucleosidase PpnN [Chromohalobacter moromii]